MFRPDGKFASVDLEGLVLVRNLTTGQEIRRFEAADGLIALAVSTDGTLIASGSRDRVVRIWKRTE